jgi:polysaccharide export outer membrane protein
MKLPLSVWSRGSTVLLLIGWADVARAQFRVQPIGVETETQAAPSRIAPITDSRDLESDYRLGPGDEITIEVLESPEFSGKRFPVGPDGDVRLPLVGRLHAHGLSVAEFESDLSKRLGEFIREPNASVTVAEFRSQPVSVIGAVASPGVQQLRGRKTLIEILSLAGGVREDAGHAVKITRRLARGRIPLPEARDDPSGGFSVAEVNLPSIVRAENPAQNIYVEPNDIISVPRAEMVYVVGAVARSGGYVLGEKQGVTALEALALAGGLADGASAKGARILRPAEGASERLEITVNLRDIMAGRSEDVPLWPDDILFVPTSGAKAAAIRAAEAALGIGSGIAIWRVGAGR